MEVKWRLPAGFSHRLAAISGSYAAGCRGVDELRLRARLRRARSAESPGKCTRKRCRSVPRRIGSPARIRSAFPSRASSRSTFPLGPELRGRSAIRSVAKGSSRARCPPSGISRRPGTSFRSQSPCPRAPGSKIPYVYPIADGSVDYPAKQEARRSGDWLIADLQRKGPLPKEFSGVLALTDGARIGIPLRSRSCSGRRVQSLVRHSAQKAVLVGGARRRSWAASCLI